MKGTESNYTAGSTTHISSDSDYILLAAQAL